MLAPVVFLVACAVVLFLLLRGSETAKSLWASEQSAYSAASKKLRSGSEGCSEKIEARVSALGDSARPASCRILKATGSRLHIASKLKFREGSQLHVERGDQCYIGTVFHCAERRGEQILSLQLQSVS